jgi:hypothetical protein
MHENETYPVMATMSAPAHRHLGQDALSPRWAPVRAAMLRFMQEHGVRTHVSMMAPGLDQVTNSVVGLSGRRTCVVRPFPDHARLWPPREREYATLATNSADEVVTTCDTHTPDAVAKANETIVGLADVLVAIDAEDSKVIANAMRRCRETGIPVYLSCGENIERGVFERT